MKIIYTLLFVLAVCQELIAQNEIKISELYVPSSPGFVLADKAPSSVEKPATPKAFGISLLSLLEGGAIEATPYWLVNHPAETFDRYQRRKVPIIQTFNISAATFKTENTSAVSLGFRTQVLKLFSKAGRDTVDSKRREIINFLSVEEFTEQDLENIDKARKELADLRSKTTLSIDIAAAIIGGSDNNSFKNLASEKSGVWTNIRFRPDKFPLDITALARYSWANNADPQVGTDSTFLDYGLSLSFQKPKFDLALEYVNRRDLSIKDNSDRFAFVINYMLNDNIIIVGSLGKNFDKVDNILTVFGVKFGLSNEKMRL